MKFRIKYGNGSEETVDNLHETTEAFINEKWGDSFAAFLEGGGQLDVVEPVEAIEPDEAPTLSGAAEEAFHDSVDGPNDPV